MEQNTEIYEIDLRDIYFIIRKRIRMILVLPLIASIIAGVIVTFAVDPTYESSVSMILLPESGSETITLDGYTYNEIRTNRELVKTYGEIARSWTVLSQVKELLALDMTVDELKETVDVSLKGETEVIQITVQHTSPQLARSIAVVVAATFKDEVVKLMRINNISILDPAILPTTPVKPNKKLTVAISFVLGLMVAVGLAFLIEFIDDSVKTPDQVEQLTGLPVLGLIQRYEEGQ